MQRPSLRLKNRHTTKTTMLSNTIESGGGNSSNRYHSIDSNNHSLSKVDADKINLNDTLDSIRSN